MGTGEAGRVFKAIYVGCIADFGGETIGAICVESVYQGLAVVVVVDAGAGADGGLCVRRVDDAQARSKVAFLLRPVSGFVIGFTGGRERDYRLEDLALLRGKFARLVPLIGIDGGRDLLAVGLIGGL